jgi:peptidoglycan/xylan/chitin deacetylase (PgdA/CDA1 family)
MARLPILMYHNVSDKESDSDGLTIYTQKLEEQFRYLTENDFNSFHLSELEFLTEIPQKSVVLTFDDVTENQLIYAVPLLEKYNLKATFFIPFGYIGKADLWNDGKEKIMSMLELLHLDSRVELGLHSFAHKKYVTLSESEINEDFDKCFRIIEQNGLKVYNAVAYPYGNYPKKEPKKTQFKRVLQHNNVKMGLRIGNKINSFPFKDPYEIMRIDVKGSDSLLKFKLKLRFGKLKLF